MRLAEVRARLATLPWMPDQGSLPSAPAGIRAVLIGEGPELARFPAASDEPRRAAALALLFADERGEARIVLMERSDDGGTHARQVALPGGSVEPDDLDTVETALREAAEEVGLDASAAGVEVVGRLETIWVAASGFTIEPVVAIAARAPHLRADPFEVAAILTPPLAAFLPGATIVEVEEVVHGWPLRYGGYPVEERVVWGATARILGQLGAVIGPG
jgi:8-oxo-dGTP pyrophosphatase MutT (NUDIX family)